MRAFKSRRFARWAAREGLTDGRLWAVVEEMERGLLDDKLAAHVYKKRIALRGRGKRGGGRAILVYRKGSRTFFMEGFAKKEQDNISEGKLGEVKGLAKWLLNCSGRELGDAVETGDYVEVKGSEQVVG